MDMYYMREFPGAQIMQFYPFLPRAASSSSYKHEFVCLPVKQNQIKKAQVASTYIAFYQFLGHIVWQKYMVAYSNLLSWNWLKIKAHGGWLDIPSIYPSDQCLPHCSYNYYIHVLINVCVCMYSYIATYVYIPKASWSHVISPSFYCHSMGNITLHLSNTFGLVDIRMLDM